MAPNEKQLIDGYLGQGMYDDWREMDDWTEKQEKEMELIQRRAGGDFGRVSHPLSFDMDNLQAIAEDYREGMKLLANGKRVDPEEIYQVGMLYFAALKVVDAQNAAVGTLVFSAIFCSTVYTIPLKLLEHRGAQLKRALEALKILLRKAEREAKKSSVKAIIKGAITGVTLFLPHVSALARLGLFAGEVLLDELTAPEEPTPTAKARAHKLASRGHKATEGAKLLAESAETASKLGESTRRLAEKAGKRATRAGLGVHVAKMLSAESTSVKVVEGVQLIGDAVEYAENTGEEIRRFAKKGAKGAALAGFYFDVDEAYGKYRKVAELRDAMNRAKDALDQTVAAIKKHRGSINRLRRELTQTAQRIRQYKENASRSRQELHGLVRDYGCQINRRKVWATAAP